MKANLKEKLILIVEDEQDIRNGLQELLESEGYSVSVAENGAEALDTLKNFEVLPCLILLDIMMPIKDGFAFKFEQDQDPRIKNIPVAIMTADTLIDIKRIQMNANACIRKPIDIDALLLTVKEQVI